ncbi:MAG: sulfatase-like hydrolase/transferase [bacterium]|nr:sulfatase-like hydrolase/transferase [bacterium]
MNRREFLCRSGLVAGAALGAGRASAAQARTAKKPNVIVIFADDQGFADLGCQGQLPDLKTPNLDRLAAEGVRCTDGYVTAPQCTPSRAGLMTGRYQQRFGLDHNGLNPMPLEETTIAARLTAAGYVTGMAGKWHLEPNAVSFDWAKANLEKVERNRQGRLINIPFEKILPYFPRHRGFQETFRGAMHRFHATYDLNGNDLDPAGEWVEDKRFRIDVQSDAAVAFLDRHHDDPFFLYVAYFAPHTPLEATDEYLAMHPGDMPERRRHALAMLSGIDRGVGRMLEKLEAYGIDEDTLIFYISDNGAPLKITMEDSPVTTDAGGWDGSRNDPFVGEKGMLSEGGIRVPFLARWKGTLPEGAEYSEPVISLDAGATALVLAGLDAPADMDGVNLIPYLTGKRKGSPHDALYWRFWTQSAIRKGKWKYLHAGNAGRFLFDLASSEHERRNLVEDHPDVAAELEKDLRAWAATLKHPGVPETPLNNQERAWYAHYFGLGRA